MVDFINPDHSRPHIPTHTCGRCRKLFKKGDRIGVALIFDRSGSDPGNMLAVGMFLQEEHEYVHIDCKDPLLIKGLT